MKINSRGELMEIINKSAVRTELVKEDDNKKLFHTTILLTRRDEFYRIVWGEVQKEDGTKMIHFKEDVEKVSWHSLRKMFLTKEEIHDFNENRNEISIEEGLEDFALKGGTQLTYNGNVLNKFTTDDSSDFSVIAGRAGTGKSLYSVKEAGKEIAKGKNVLYISAEEEFEEIIPKLLSASSYYLRKGKDVDENSLDDVAKFVHSIKTEEELAKCVEEISGDTVLPNIKIVNSYVIDEQFIFKEMKRFVEEYQKLDLVVIDSLTLPNSGNLKPVLERYKKLDEYRRIFGSKIIVTAQANAKASNMFIQ